MNSSAMKCWAMLSAAGFVLVAFFLILNPDMRGWTPGNLLDPQVRIEPIDNNGAPFSVADCVPGSIDPNQTPRGPDYGYQATMRVLTCRSRSSALNIVALYLLAVLAYPAGQLLRRLR